MLPPKEMSPPPSPSLSSPSPSPTPSPPSDGALGNAASGGSIPQATTCNHPIQISRGHFSPFNPTFHEQTRAQEAPQEIPLYLPHHEVLERAEYCLVSPIEDGLSSPRSWSPGVRGSEGCQDIATSFGDTRTIHTGPHPTEEKDKCLTDQQLSFKAGENTRERHTSPRTGEGGSEMASKKKPSLKKLVLTEEQKTSLLDWNIPTPVNLRLDVGKQPSQKSSDNGRGRVLKPARPLTLPQATREALSSHKDPPEKVGTQAEQSVGERNVAPPKSPLRFLTNVIRRSLEPLLPNSEGGKKGWAKPKSKTLITNQPHTCTRSFSLRKTNYNKDWDQQSPERDMTSKTSSFFSRGSPKAAQPSCLSPPDPVLHTCSLPNRPSKTFSDLESPHYSKMDDVPTLLEKVSLQETLTEPSNRRFTFFSSLRLKDKSSENVLQESKQTVDLRDIFTSCKGKALPMDNAHTLEKLVHPNSNTDLEPMDPSPAADPRPSHIPIGAQGAEAVSSLSSTTSSSADEEFNPQPSLRSKERKTLKRRKKLERATKQLIKQEELKRLYKAQAIQRQLEEVEEQQRAYEIQGVKLEKALRGEADSGTHDEAQLLQEWFKLVLEKNKLTRYESELLITAQELELEDHQSRLEQKLREKMLKEESQKDENDRNEEQEILNKMMQVIEQRDKLVDSLEEQRVKEKAEDQHFESFMFPRGYQLSRT
ncbi:PREDICTED: MICAL C-terminal-like protein [Elephantulus edwardii]|uniref:MICAL C-terminal-like protein n=1 Tax=Elephantulus edwardii TaxID=28737 RepID=UPI0003F06693|nr:PREDICTED: MICAL C-terminal-like protein [Elephantulus edwardii]